MPKEISGEFRNMLHQMQCVITSIDTSNYEQIRTRFFSYLTKTTNLVTDKFHLSKGYRENAKIWSTSGAVDLKNRLFKFYNKDK